MDFYLADKDRNDICQLPDSAELDHEDSDTDDTFQLELPLAFCMQHGIQPGCYMYALGTEYGGRITSMEIDTKEKVAKFIGDTFRGMLSKKILIPSTGSYINESGDANSIMKRYIESEFDSIKVSADTSVNVSAKFRFSNYHDGFKCMLKEVDHRMMFVSKVDDDTNKFYVEVSAVPAEDLSDLDEVSQDMGYYFKIKKVGVRYTHLLALGCGQLEDRIVLYGKINKDNSITWISSFPSGENVRILKYDYPNAEDEDSLKDGAPDYVSDKNPIDSQAVTVKDGEEFNIGDIIGGRDYYTGTTIKEEVTGKIVKLINGALTISYKIGG